MALGCLRALAIPDDYVSPDYKRYKASVVSEQWELKQGVEFTMEPVDKDQKLLHGDGEAPYLVRARLKNVGKSAQIYLLWNTPFRDPVPKLSSLLQYLGHVSQKQGTQQQQQQQQIRNKQKRKHTCFTCSRF